MPAAAVIPAPIAYTKVVAVKKLVVGFLRGRGAHCAKSRVGQQRPRILPRTTLPLVWWRLGDWLVYFEKNRVFKAGNSP